MKVVAQKYYPNSKYPLYELNINDLYLTPTMLVELMKMVEDGKISSKQSKW